MPTICTQTPFGSLGRLIAPASPTDADREQCYQAALKLVERIDDDLTRGTYYYRNNDGELLLTLDQVVVAILDDDLLLPEDVLNAN